MLIKLEYLFSSKVQTAFANGVNIKITRSKCWGFHRVVFLAVVKKHCCEMHAFSKFIQLLTCIELF